MLVIPKIYEFELSYLQMRAGIYYRVRYITPFKRDKRWMMIRRQLESS
jgi:hypothetical protein